MYSNAELPTIRQLKYLSAIAETKHFRKAADLMRVSQPSLSAQLQTLEQKLGVQLVERSRSGVSLTPVGREIVERGNRILREVQGMIDLAAGAEHGLVGTIRLGAAPTLGPYLLPPVVLQLHQQHKALKLHIRESLPRDLEKELEGGVHDVIFVQLPVRNQDLISERLFREPLYLAMAADHPLASKEDLGIADLKGVDVLSLSSNYNLHDQSSALCKDFGAILARNYEGTSLDALRQMVGMGMGVAFLPALYVRSEIPDRGDVVVRKLLGRDVYRECGLAWRKSSARSESFLQLSETMRDVADKKFKDLTASGR